MSGIQDADLKQKIKDFFKEACKIMEDSASDYDYHSLNNSEFESLSSLLDHNMSFSSLYSELELHESKTNIAKNNCRDLVKVDINKEHDTLRELNHLNPLRIDSFKELQKSELYNIEEERNLKELKDMELKRIDELDNLLEHDNSKKLQEFEFDSKTNLKEVKMIKFVNTRQDLDKISLNNATEAYNSTDSKIIELRTSKANDNLKKLDNLEPIGLTEDLQKLENKETNCINKNTNLKEDSTLPPLITLEDNTKKLIEIIEFTKEIDEELQMLKLSDIKSIKDIADSTPIETDVKKENIILKSNYNFKHNERPIIDRELKPLNTNDKLKGNEIGSLNEDEKKIQEDVTFKTECDNLLKPVDTEYKEEKFVLKDNAKYIIEQELKKTKDAENLQDIKVKEENLKELNKSEADSIKSVENLIVSPPIANEFKEEKNNIQTKDILQDKQNQTIYKENIMPKTVEKLNKRTEPKLDLFNSKSGGIDLDIYEDLKIELDRTKLSLCYANKYIDSLRTLSDVDKNNYNKQITNLKNSHEEHLKTLILQFMDFLYSVKFNYNKKTRDLIEKCMQLENSLNNQSIMYDTKVSEYKAVVTKKSSLDRENKNNFQLLKNFQTKYLKILESNMHLKTQMEIAKSRLGLFVKEHQLELEQYSENVLQTLLEYSQKMSNVQNEIICEKEEIEKLKISKSPAIKGIMKKQQSYELCKNIKSIISKKENNNMTNKILELKNKFSPSNEDSNLKPILKKVYPDTKNNNYIFKNAIQQYNNQNFMNIRNYNVLPTQQFIPKPDTTCRVLKLMQNQMNPKFSPENVHSQTKSMVGVCRTPSVKKTGGTPSASRTNHSSKINVKKPVSSPSTHKTQVKHSNKNIKNNTKPKSSKK